MQVVAIVALHNGRLDLIAANSTWAVENSRAAAASVSRKRLGSTAVDRSGQWMITDARMSSGSLKMMVIASVGVIWPEASSVIWTLGSRSFTAGFQPVRSCRSWRALVFGYLDLDLGTGRCPSECCRCLRDAGSAGLG